MKKITIIGQIQNKGTGLGKALDDFIRYAEEKNGSQNVEQIDIASNARFFSHIFRILTSTSHVFYFTPSGSKFGAWRDSVYLLAMRLKRKRIVCHFHNSNFGNVIASDGLLRLFSKFLYQGVNRIILLGEKQKEMFEQISFPQERFTLIQNGIDSYLFLESEKIVEKHLRPSKNVIYFSNMLPEKGYQLVLESAERLKGEELSFYFSGKFFDQELEKSFNEKRSSLTNVTYINGVYGLEKSRLLSEMNIFVLPSSYKDETLPISMLEAMASGCYIIVSDVGVISEVVNSDTTTLLSREELNVENVTRAILSALPTLEHLDFQVSELRERFENREVQDKIFQVVSGEN